MRTIDLTQGKQAKVCDCHYDLVRDHKWSYHPSGGGYANRTDYSLPKKKTIGMHRVIAGATAGVQVDHKNMDRLDNQCDNLRLCTRAQNYANQERYKNNTSGFKGVDYRVRLRKWAARVQVNGERVYLGLFDSPESAALAYNSAAKEHFGEFARLNRVGV